MNWADFTNGVFEAGTGLTALHSCWKLYQHKRVQGVSHWLMAWVSLWGYWNLYYYPSLDQWLSFCGGLLIVTANTVWLSLAWRYRRGKPDPRCDVCFAPLHNGVCSEDPEHLGRHQITVLSAGQLLSRKK